MEDFWRSVTSPGWWLGVVVVGIAINLVTPFVGQLLRKGMTNAVSSWQERSKTAKERKELFIHWLVRSPLYRIEFAVQSNRHRLAAITWFLAFAAMGVSGTLLKRSSLEHSGSLGVAIGLIVSLSLALAGACLVKGAHELWAAFSGAVILDEADRLRSDGEVSTIDSDLSEFERRARR